jgi:GDPmannose 4,6-dehydratase
MLWNHEGERRGPSFVTRKITMCIARQLNGSDETLQLGNLDSVRDWGYAPDFCDAMILMLEADKPDDYAVATGETHTIREFVEEAYSTVGISIHWIGNGAQEKGYDDAGKLLIEVNPEFYRPVEVPYLHGDYTETKEKIGWEPTTKFKELVKIMIKSDIKSENNGKNN